MNLESLKELEKSDLKRYAIFTAGLILSLGFAFGAVASFSAIVDTQPSGQQGEQVQPPTQNFQEESFELNQEAQFQLAFFNDIAFINAYYTNEEEKQSMREDLEDLPEEFDNRVFVQLVNESNQDTLAFEFTNRIEEFPAYIIVGGNQDDSNRITDGGLRERQQVIEDVCAVMRDWSGLGQCQAL